MVRWKQLLLVFTMCWAGSFSAEMIYGDPILDDPTHPLHVSSVWNYTKHGSLESMGQLVKKMMPMVLRSSSDLDISGPCMAALFKMVLAIPKQKWWAMRLMDAWGKPPGGLFTGSLAALGDYDECVETVITDLKDPKGDPQLGMYCLVTYVPMLPPKPQLYTLYHKIPDLANISKDDTSFGESARNAQWFYLLKLKMGVCMPNSCTKQDIKNILDEVPKLVKVKGELIVQHCETKQGFHVDNGQIAVLSVVGIVAFLMLIGTSVDVIVTLRRGSDPEPASITKKLGYRLLICFSVYTNLRKLLNTKTSGESNLGSIAGVRFITVTWVIVGHSYLYADYNMMKQGNRLQYLPSNFAFQIIANAMLTVDTYILMSGLLVTYSVLKSQEKRKGINIPMYIFHRFWRLTPPYMMTIAFLIAAPILASGPQWKVYLDPLIANCKANWWTNLLYVNNFVNAENFCLEHTWYLAADMQLHILGLFVIVPLIKWPKMAAVIGFLLVVGFSVVAGLINVIYDLPPSPLGLFPDPDDRIYVEVPNYFKPYGHVGPYFLGVLLGYILVKKNSIRVPQFYRTLGWLFFTTMNLLVMYGAYTWNTGTPWNHTVSALYGGTSKIVWAMGIFWMLFVCCTGNGGIINDILCWKAWIPLSRISFVIYLIHPIVIWVHEAFAHDRMYTSHYFWVYNIFGHFMTSTAVALIMSLAFEAPFLAMEKIIFGGGGGKRSSSANQKNGKMSSFGSELKSNTYTKNKDYSNGGNETNGYYRNGNGIHTNGNGIHSNGNGIHSNGNGIHSSGIYRNGSSSLGRIPKESDRHGGIDNGSFCRL